MPYSADHNPTLKCGNAQESEILGMLKMINHFHTHGQLHLAMAGFFLQVQKVSPKGNSSRNFFIAQAHRRPQRRVSVGLQLWNEKISIAPSRKNQH